MFQSIVFRLKMQKSTVLEKKNDFERILIDLKCMWLQSGLGKTPNTCIFAYGRFFTLF